MLTDSVLFIFESEMPYSSPTTLHHAPTSIHAPGCLAIPCVSISPAGLVHSRLKTGVTSCGGDGGGGADGGGEGGGDVGGGGVGW